LQLSARLVQQAVVLQQQVAEPLVLAERQLLAEVVFRPQALLAQELALRPVWAEQVSLPLAEQAQIALELAVQKPAARELVGPGLVDLQVADKQPAEHTQAAPASGRVVPAPVAFDPVAFDPAGDSHTQVAYCQEPHSDRDKDSLAGRTAGPVVGHTVAPVEHTAGLAGRVGVGRVGVGQDVRIAAQVDRIVVPAARIAVAVPVVAAPVAFAPAAAGTAEGDNRILVVVLPNPLASAYRLVANPEDRPVVQQRPALLELPRPRRADLGAGFQERSVDLPCEGNFRRGRRV
jgi:hypothetical protein